MTAQELRGEAEEDFREGTARPVGLRTDFGQSSVVPGEGEDRFFREPKFRFELSQDDRLARLVRRKYEDKVVAVHVPTGEEIAVADDTHELTEMLLELEYNEEATMIVRCHGRPNRDNQIASEEVRGRDPRQR